MLLNLYLSAVLSHKTSNPILAVIGRRQNVGRYRFIEAIIDDPQSVPNDISTFAGRVLEFSKLFSRDGGIVGLMSLNLEQTARSISTI